MVHVLVVCLAALGADRASSASQDEPRPYHAIQAEIADLLKQEAQAKQPAARATAVRRMCELHGEILRNARYATSDTLNEYRIRLWSRLRRVQADLKQQIARSAEKGDKQSAEDYATLASADAATVAAADSLAESLAMLDQSQGGPGYLFGFGGRGASRFWPGSGRSHRADDQPGLLGHQRRPRDDRLLRAAAVYRRSGDVRSSR